MASVSRNGIKSRVIGGLRSPTSNAISPTGHAGGGGNFRTDSIRMDEINILHDAYHEEEEAEEEEPVFRGHAYGHCHAHFVQDQGVQTTESKLPALRRSKSSRRSARQNPYR